MKILIIGSNNNTYNLENSYKRAFQFKNIECEVFDIHATKNVFLRTLDHSKVYKVFSNSKIRSLFSYKFNKNLMEYIYEFKPNIIFFFSLNYIFPENIDKLKKNFQIISFLSDDFIFNNSFFRREVIESLKLININFCFGKKTKKYLSKYSKSFYLDFAWDNLIKKIPNKNLKRKILFCGHYDNERFNILKSIIELDNLTIYGNSKWKIINDINISTKVNNQLNYRNYIKSSKESLININILRKQNLTCKGLNMRTFELGGEKCFFLQNYSEEGANLFQALKKSIFFRNSEELNFKIEEFSKNRSLINETKKKIFKIINSDHKYLDRVNFLLKKL